MSNYLHRLDVLEAKLGTATRRSRLILVSVREGKDEAAKIAKARLANGLQRDDKALVIVESVSCSKSVLTDAVGSN